MEGDMVSDACPAVNAAWRERAGGTMARCVAALPAVRALDRRLIRLAKLVAAVLQGRDQSAASR